MLILTPSVRTAPSSADYIADSKLDATLIEEVMRQAKAAEMANFMDESVDPCFNFYDFACGNWPRINPAIGPGQYTTGLFERLTDGFDRKVKHTLNSENSDLDTAEDVQVKNFYKSCTQVRQVDASYQQKMRDIIAEFGAMPALEGESWHMSNFDWLETVARIAYRYGLVIIMGVEVTKDFANNEVNVVYIGEQEFVLESRNMYLDNHTASYRMAYTISVAKKLVTFLGMDMKMALPTATELMDFEVQLAKGLINEGDGLSISDISQLKTVAQMQREYAPHLNVERLVNISLGEQVTDSVYDFNSNYQRNVINVMKRTSPGIVANYIFYRLIDEFAMDPGTTHASRQDKCILITKKYFAKNLDNMIYRRYNNNVTASDIDLIWGQLKSTFKQKLQSDQSLKWISRRTREAAINKLDAMTLQVNSHADEDLTEDFAGLQLHVDDFIENLRQTRILGARQERELLHQPVKPLEAGDLLSYTPANILVENTIRVPVSLLQPYYLWAGSYPNAIKFGTLASLIGHELIHGFDDSGRKFDARGNVNDWWDAQSESNFVDRQRCFTNQYSKYTYHGIRLPKTTAQSENIADNGGMRLAYAAYSDLQDAQERTVEGRKQLLREKLPTLNYTKMQLFFISYAQIWCNDAHPRVRHLQVSTDLHMPGEFRVIGPLSNFGEFAKEFQCAVGTRMNPPRKCMIY
ncbi:GH13212 [Drosophila grimshawi]|uniref:GH13212 n=2 Tax=Drosophila grimshawi TaxID=7222 RepID=B4JU01_DROGR|nr:GH13212 [Drosophila grimshawi]